MPPDSITDSDTGTVLPNEWQLAIERRRSRIFGDRLDDALASRSATEQFLSDTDPTIRSGALRLIIEHWHPTASSEELYRKIALTDPDSGVRVDALWCWSHLYRGSGNKEFSTMLAGFILNESEPVQFRGNAYIQLFAVQSLPVPSKLRVFQSLVYDKNRVLEEFDWEFVKKFL